MVVCGGRGGVEHHGECGGGAVQAAGWSLEQERRRAWVTLDWGRKIFILSSQHHLQGVAEGARTGWTRTWPREK